MLNFLFTPVFDIQKSVSYDLIFNISNDLIFAS